MRSEEARKAGKSFSNDDLAYLGREGPVSNWYVDPSLGLILSGSRNWELADDEFTRLSPEEIIHYVEKALERISTWTVDRWRKILE